MKTIEQQKSLKAYNTFGVECFCEYFTSVSTTEELVAALLQHPEWQDFNRRARNLRVQHLDAKKANWICHARTHSIQLNYQGKHPLR